MTEIIKNFEKNDFTAKYFETREQATKYLYENICDQEVTFGGSVTAVELGLQDILAEKNKVFYHGKDGFMNENPKVYICSANALTKDGQIVNIDGRGNRVAATIHGSEAVYIVCGVNKIEDDLNKAIFRAKNIAAPLNARRLNKNTPCAKGELKCYNCNSSARICRTTVIMDKKNSKTEKFEIIIINEKLGY